MYKNLKFKIILSSVISLLIVGVFSNVYLYHYLTGIITEKSANIDRLNLQTVQSRLDTMMEELSSLAGLCAYDLRIARGMRNRQMTTVAEKQAVLQAQETLQRYLDAQSIGPYISRLIVFNEDGIRAQAVTREMNGMTDVPKVMEGEAFQRFMDGGRRQSITVAPSIADGRDVLTCISCVFELPQSVRRGYLYIEMDPEFIDEVLSPYPSGSLFVAGTKTGTPADTGMTSEGRTAGTGITAEGSFSGDIIFPAGADAPDMLTGDGRVYQYQSVPLKYAGLSLFSRTDITFLSADAHTVLFTTIVVILTAVAAALILAVLLGHIITKPLNRLTKRLRRISANDFNRDPTIETGGGEIAEMGRVVNDMADSIKTLLRETEEMYLQQKNAEIALLQAQVNPHFLYNTLDTIRWMAVIQKNPGIEKTVRSLSNLLKNLAKGMGDKITLEEELSLLKDYIATQSARFMDLLEFTEQVEASFRDCLIVKFTLQPLIENAIFHGIEPSGAFGRILVSAALDGDYLLIFVEDNGVGMTAEELAAVANEAESPHPMGMSGIGIANVNNRLKLVYGADCGLQYESRPGLYTRVTVRIRKERADVPSPVS